MIETLIARPTEGDASSRPVRLGQVDYVNVLPVYMGLDEEGTSCELVRGVPTDLNTRLRQGDIDCAPVSAIEMAHARGAYALLPGISISSVGAVGSSMLISWVPVERLGGGSVALTTHSAASLAFFRILCARLWHIEVATVDVEPDLDAMLGDHDACVLIGNPAIVATVRARDRGDLFVTDLGEAWFELTGLPAVFAVWALHADWARAHPAGVEALRADLERGRAWGLDRANHTRLCARAAAETGLSMAEMEAYFAKQDYRLGDEHAASLRRYFDELADLDLAPPLPTLEFLP
jgi:chorismate dehydratase